MRGGIFVYHQGFLCLKWSDTESSAPIRVTWYWPFFRIKENEVADILGTEAYDERNGVFAARVAGGGWRRFQLQDGGQTKAIDIMREPIPCPHVRRGIETRYRAGRWEKYLKTQGWVAA